MKNTYYLLVIFLISSFLGGCASLGDMKGGFFPAESFNEYKARIKAEGEDLKIQERRGQLAWIERHFDDKKKLQIRPTLKIEDYETPRRGSEIIITPSLSGDPDRSNGFRDAREYVERRKDHEFRRLVHYWAREDAKEGWMDFRLVPGKYLQYYEQVFENSRDWRRIYRQRRESYREGWNDYFRK